MDNETQFLSNYINQILYCISKLSGSMSFYVQILKPFETHISCTVYQIKFSDQDTIVEYKEPKNNIQ